VLTVANNLAVAPATFLTFALGSADARLSVMGSLALFSRINLTNGPGFHPGTYTLCASGGSFSGQPSLGSTPPGYTCVLDTSVPQQLNVIVTSPSRVQAWGDDSDGQTETFPALSNAVAVVAGGFHNLALQSDGSVLAWGDDSHGQTNVPPTLTNVISVAAGAYHSLAALAGGSVVAWGDNSSNQTAVPLTATNVVAVAAGDWHSLALRSDGTVEAWGDNTWGQCDVPSAASNVVALAAGNRHSLALRADGSVIAWGGNLGADGSYLGQAVAPDLRHVAAIAAGGFQSLALLVDGQVMGWGSPIPPPLTNATAIAAGWNSGLAALTGGTVIGWGDDSCGETNIDPTLAQVTAVAGGACHSLALQGAPPSPLLLLGPNLEGDNFTVAAPTVRGRPVFLLAKDLNETNWHFVVGAGGLGLVQTLRDPSVSPTRRFYQVRQ
jgi:alpha-tubulin suppressor-like RCC1 family protein